MSEIVYFLCALLSVACALILYRGFRESRSQLLFWSCMCFAFLGANNVLLLIDMTIFADVDISGPFWRNILSAIAGSVLLFGLIWEIT